MRLSTDENGDEERALQTIAAAAEAGITVFDTARAYGDNEKLLARALRHHPKARIVTKGGMRRDGGAWIPDGRAKAILADCEASLKALDGLPIDLFLIHVPDPRTPWSTSVRALARILDEGLAKHVGVSNVNRDQLQETLASADITAVEVALNPFDDHAVRGAVLQLCEEKGLTLIAYSPLGGPKRAPRLAKNQALVDVARANNATAAEVALAWLLATSPAIVAIPGARRPETARSAARAAQLHLSVSDHAAVDGAFGRRKPPEEVQVRSTGSAEVVLIMGIPGAGKSRLAEEYVARGYARLNRDERGGSLKELAFELEHQLLAGTRVLVLDNTYLTRAARSHIIETAHRHGASTRCVWLDTPLAQAQINLIARLLDRFGHLPSPEEIARVTRTEPGLHTPTSQMRTVRQLEIPSMDEGFTEVERVPFSRSTNSRVTQSGVFVAADAMRRPEWKAAIAQSNPESPHLVFDWCPEGCTDALAAATVSLSTAVTGPVESSYCPHGGGPPICWCRPPLPGLPLAFARVHGIDPSRSIVVGTAPTHRTLANALGATYFQI